MPSRCLMILLLLPVLCLAAQRTSDPLAPGNNLPGTFHAYNINMVVPPPTTVVEEPKSARPRIQLAPYSTKFKYHCLISEFDLDPSVLLLVRGTEANDALKDFLRKLDRVIDDNRRFVRLRVALVFVPNDLNNVIEEDGKREMLAKQLEAFVEDLKLRNIAVALAAKSDLAKYQLDDSTAMTAILYSKLKILATHRWTADILDEAAMNRLAADIKAKLGVKK